MKLCDDCGLLPATVHLMQVANGNEPRSFNLCMECAKKRGINITIGETAAADDASPVPVQRPAVPERECPSCRMKLSDFRSRGRLGCPACYGAFAEEIDTLFRQVHGSSEHKGKKYRCAGAKDPGEGLSRLRFDLASAIKNEEFERAALLRDAIHGRKGIQEE
jgi:protein arginine kinase activator